jgi:hypothetical protein
VTGCALLMCSTPDATPEERSGFSGELESLELSLSVGGMSYSLAKFRPSSAGAELCEPFYIPATQASQL